MLLATAVTTVQWDFTELEQKWRLFCVTDKYDSQNTLKGTQMLLLSTRSNKTGKKIVGRSDGMFRNSKQFH